MHADAGVRHTDHAWLMVVPSTLHADKAFSGVPGRNRPDFIAIVSLFNFWSLLSFPCPEMIGEYNVCFIEPLLVKVKPTNWHAQMCFCLICVVGQNPPTGVDRQHESREARSIYLSALQLARALRLRFVGRAT
jgi:hypothetical protein